jgi:hypothetical protein
MGETQGLGYAKAERTASPDANRTLKAVAESVPNACGLQNHLFFGICSFLCPNSRRMWTVRLVKRCSLMMSTRIRL